MATKQAASLICKTEPAVEAYKTALLKSVSGVTPALTICYNNLFEAEIKSCREDLTDPALPEKTRDTIKATLKAWERAHHLFLELAPVLLAELVSDIATQIEAEYRDEPIVRDDVPASLRRIDLFELLRHEC